MRRKLLSVILTFAMVLSLIPAFTIPAKAAETTYWEEVDMADVSSGDVLLICMVKSGTAYILSAENGSSSAPPATAFPFASLVSNGKFETSNTVNSNYQWTVTVTNSSYQFANGSNYLYCTSTNNGVRVGSNSNKAFTVDGDYLKNTATSRFLGIYNTQDWRCYTSKTTNIGSQTLQVWRQYTPAPPAGDHTLSYSAVGDGTHTITCATANCTVAGHSGTVACEYGAVNQVTAPTCGAAGSGTETCEKCSYVHNVTIPATGEHTLGAVTEVTAPTCNTPGTGTATCSTCGQTVNVEIPATGAHTDANGDFVCDDCGNSMVTKLESIAIGNIVVITCDSKGTMLTGISNNLGQQAAYTDVADLVASAMRFTVVEGNQTGTYAFLNGSSDYLSAANSNNLYVIDSVTDASSWTVTFENGDAILTNVAYTTRHLRYNSQNPRFCCYESAQTMIQLYIVGQAAVSHTHNYQWDGVMGDGHHTMICSNDDGNCPLVSKSEACTFVTDSETVATCGAAGSRTETCSVCHYSHTIETPATGLHIDGNSDGFCDECGLDMESDQAFVDAAYLLGENEYLLDEQGNQTEITLTGRVTEVVEAYTTTYNNVTVDIVIEGREDKPIRGFRIEGSDAQYIAKGSIITVKGKIMRYVKNTTDCIEFVAKSELQSAKYFFGRNVTLHENLSCGLFTGFNAAGNSEAKIVVTMNGVSSEIPASEAAEQADGSFRFNFDGLLPAEVNNEITAVLQDGSGKTLDTVTFTLKSYLEDLRDAASIPGYSAEKKAALNTLITDLLAYSAAAQVQFPTQVEDGKTFTATGSGRAPAGDVYNMDPVVNASNVDTITGYFKYATVVHENTNWIRLEYVGATENVTFTIDYGNGEEAISFYQDSKFICTKNLMPTEYATTITVRAKLSGTTFLTLTYSVNSYCVRKASLDFAVALYNYGVSAAAFVAAN